MTRKFTSVFELADVGARKGGRSWSSAEDNGTSSAGRAALVVWLALFFVAGGYWAVYYVQFHLLPTPLSPEEAGEKGFSEDAAIEHLKALTEFGPRVVGSAALDGAVKYVYEAAENIRKTAPSGVDVQVDLFKPEAGANRLVGGNYKGKTHLYSGLKYVVLRILPKDVPEASQSAILFTSHVDTVFAGPGAGDDGSCNAVMLELARGVCHWAHGFNNSVIFLFNTGEEDGLNGAYSFVTQHPWSSTVQVAVDLEASGIGGKSNLFQGGTYPWVIDTFAKAAKYPSGQILLQDAFQSGFIQSSTDFQVFVEVAGVSGLDFAYSELTAVYHTKNDRLAFLRPGSLQHLGENILAFVIQAGNLPKKGEDMVPEKSVYFEVLGMYMFTFRQRHATMVYNAVIFLSVLIGIASLLMGGLRAAVALALSLVSIVLMWIFSVGFSALVAILLLPRISPYPAPFIANQGLLLGLFAAPAVVGALTGQGLGFLILQCYLSRALSSEKRSESAADWEAESWLFKSGFLQWLVVLILLNALDLGSTYLAVVWLVSPAVAYGLNEATSAPVQQPKPMRIATLLSGVTLPILVSSGLFVQLVGGLVGNIIRLDTNPGSMPEWQGSLVVAVYISAVICLTFIFLFSYVHLSGAKTSMVASFLAVFGLTLAAILAGTFPAFTEDISRGVNVVHIVETDGGNASSLVPASYVALFSMTPGKLDNVIETLKSEEFSCGTSKELDMVTFTAYYGCWSHKDSSNGWSHVDIPVLKVENDNPTANTRITHVSMDAKISTRWSLGINAEKVEDFSIGISGEDSRPLVPFDNKTSSHGWYTVQFAGGEDSPARFDLMLVWSKDASSQRTSKLQEDSHLLLKLRTDLRNTTPAVENILEDLPPWCSLYGKSFSPFTLSFLTSLPIGFSELSST